MSERAKTTVEFSPSEAAFSFLVDCTTIAVKPLSKLAINAVKAHHSTSWKDLLSSCFSGGMQKYVKESVDDSGSLEDVFAVCKIIRCRINDITEYVGVKLKDPRDRERLSLHVQGVEAARHMAFHGELVSMAEVHSCVHLLISILAYVGGGQEELLLLMAFAERISEAFHSESDYYHALSIGTVLKTMLYRSFVEFENCFTVYLANHPLIVLQQDHSKSLAKKDWKRNNSCQNVALKRKILGCNSFHQLCKTIESVFYLQQKEKKAAKNKKGQNYKFSCATNCAKVIALRNRFAHNKNIPKIEVIRGLQSIQSLLKAFNLKCTKTESALNNVRSFLDMEDQPVSVLIVPTSDYRHVVSSRQRILRPGGGPFVGRRREISIIKERLCSNELAQSRVVLIIGAAGVGKSYLANKLVFDTQSAQSWIRNQDKTSWLHQLFNSVCFTVVA